MEQRRAGRLLSPYAWWLGLLLALSLVASGCAANGSATSVHPDEATVVQSADADTENTEERRDDPAKWRKLDTDKDEEAVVATAWLVTVLAGIALSILGVVALF